MSKTRPGTKGYLKKHVAKSHGKDETTFLVSAEDKSDKENPYHGPTARITWDDTWLNICTDDYEGNAMINIEALPYLRRALSQVARAIKAASAKP